MIRDFFLALDISMTSGIPFKRCFQRLRHIRHGHPHEQSARRIDKLTSEHHPHTDADWVFTVNIVECECGLIYFDSGLERRKK